MKIKKEKDALFFGLILAGALLAGCGSVVSSAVNPSVDTSVTGNIPTEQKIRLVDTAGYPVANVVVAVYPEQAKNFIAGVTNGQGEIELPVWASAVYTFTRGGKILFAQTAQNLFSIGPSAASFYRRDGNVLIVPLNLAPAVSPLMSPVIDPLNTAPPRVGQ